MAEALRRFGPYRLGPQLGAGSGGTVNLAWPTDPRLPRPLVIKRLAAAARADEHFVARFRHEARVAVLGSGAAIARVFDVGAVGEELYIAMEFIPGVPAAVLTSRILDSKAPLPLAVAKALIDPVLAGLEELHAIEDPTTGRSAGFVHRDLAPKNLILTPGGSVRVIDLGIGKSALQGFETRTGILMGTPGYMAPEQILGGAVDARADLYVAAVILYEWLTAEAFVPRGELLTMLRATAQPKWTPARDLDPTLPAEIDALFGRMLCANPQDRLPTAGELRQAIAALPSERPHVSDPNVQAVLAGYVAPVEPAAALAPPEDASEARTEVFARHPDFGATAEETPSPSDDGPRPADLRKTRSERPPALPDTVRTPRRRSPRPIPRAVWGLLIVGLASLGAGLWTARARRTTPAPAPAAPQAPVVTARPAAPPPPEAISTPRTPDAGAPRRERPPAKAPARRPPEQVGRTAPGVATPAAPDTVDPDQVGAELLKRLRALQSELPREAAPALRRLRGDIERDRRVRTGAAAAIRRLEGHRRQLDQLEQRYRGSQ